MSDLKENATPVESKAEPKQAPVQLRAMLAEKVGMTQVFDAEGNLKGVTVLKAGPCTVTTVRTPAQDGYNAVCLGFGEADTKKLSKPMAGQFAKIKVTPVQHLKEYRLSDVAGFEIGQVVTLKDRFQPGDYVDVQGITKGRGFAGGMKRHGFRGMPASHGASDKERAPGSLASRRSLGRVIPGQRMAGHMGQTTMTMSKIEVVKVDADKNLIYVCGSVPGTNGSIVSLLETSKNRKRRLVVAKVAKKGAAKAAPKKK